jgi:hypothetical protein
MNTATFSLILFIIQEAIKLEPALVAELKAIFSADNVTSESLAALRAKIAGETYENLTGTTIPVEQPASVPVVVLPPPAGESASPPAPETPAPAPEAAVAAPDATAPAPVKCPKCGKELVPDSPDNCNC